MTLKRRNDTSSNVANRAHLDHDAPLPQIAHQPRVTTSGDAVTYMLDIKISHRFPYAFRSSGFPCMSSKMEPHLSRPLVNRGEGFRRKLFLTASNVYGDYVVTLPFDPFEDFHAILGAIIADKVDPQVALNTEVAMGSLDTSIDGVEHPTVVKTFADVVRSREARLDVSDIAPGVIFQHLINDAFKLILICDAIDYRAVNRDEVRKVAVLEEALDLLHRPVRCLYVAFFYKPEQRLRARRANDVNMLFNLWQRLYQFLGINWKLARTSCPT